MSHTRRAVLLAADSEYGDRLVDIAREHTRLARRISDIRKMGLREASALYDRLDDLRREREEIIERFEGGEQVGTC